MSELPRLAARLSQAAARDATVVLATIVDASASTHCRPGDWMVIEDGEHDGQLSGGGLDPDVLERAAGVLGRGKAQVASYDTRRENAVFGLGAGCQGVVRILIEPLSGERLRASARVFELASEGGALVTVLAGAGDETPGDRYLIGPRPASTTARPLPSELARLVRIVLFRPEPTFLVTPDGLLEVSVQTIRPTPALLLCGAGDDARPLAALAVELGWSVTVADHRPALASSERFPGARVVVLDDAASLPIADRPRQAAVVMSHHAERDSRYLAQLLPRRLDYLGVLGPRSRTEELLAVAERLAERPRVARVHGPVGLDIGAETAREVALSVVAEIAAVLAGRAGGPLTDREAAPRAGEALPREARPLARRAVA